jgi:hypothetical protein
VPGTSAPVNGQATHVLILFARSQTEQVDSLAGCRAKLERLSAGMANDGEPSLVLETDRVTPGEIGTYVVHRGGAQAAAELVIRP